MDSLNSGSETKLNHPPGEFRGLVDQTLNGIFYQLEDEGGTRIPLEAFSERSIPPEFLTQIKTRENESVTATIINHITYVKTVFRPFGGTSQTKIYRRLDDENDFVEVHRG